MNKKDDPNLPIDDFASAVGDVKRIASNDVHHFDKRTQASDSQRYRREAAQRKEEQDPNYLSSAQVDMVDPFDILSFQRPGMQHGVFRKLRLGQYQQEASLDLHRHTIEQGRKAVFNFVRDCLRCDIRTAIIVHGMGRHANPPALMKSYVNKWLREIPEVMAFHSCQKQHGSVGAVYLLMKKSQRRKVENRERFQKRKGNL